MKTIPTKLFKGLSPLLIYAFGSELIETITYVSLGDIIQAVFLISVALSFVGTHLLVKTYGYFAVLVHELTHTIWGVLTFNKPRALNVLAGQGGNFVFQGKHNLLSVLSPYFFPTLAFAVFPIYFIVSTTGALVYFGLLGATLGFSFSIALRQCKPHQSDLHVYGVRWSYSIILFFQIFIWGLFLSFVIGRMPMVWSFITMGIDNITELYGLGRSLISK
jgi:hypothetical protein